MHSCGFHGVYEIGEHFLVNPLQCGVAFLYPLKSSENLQGYRKATPGCNGLVKEKLFINRLTIKPRKRKKALIVMNCFLINFKNLEK